MRSKGLLHRLAASVCLLLALDLLGCSGEPPAPPADSGAEQRHAEILAALQRIEATQEKLAARVKGTASKVESMVARGVMVIPPGQSWEKRSAFRIPASGSPVKGPVDAPIRIVEFVDFQCPYCRANAGLADGLLAEFPNDVQIVFKHDPITRKHEHAESAALAAFAAYRQGKFWEMHDRLFESGRLAPDDLREHAEAIGLNLKRFEALRASPAARAAIGRDRTLARDLGAAGTPAYFVNGKSVDGASYDAVRAAVRAELRLLAEQGKIEPRDLPPLPGVSADRGEDAVRAAPPEATEAAPAPAPDAPAGAPAEAS